MQSLVPSLSPNKLIPFSIFFSFVYLSLDKIISLRIDKNRTPTDCHKSGPLRIGKNSFLPEWQKNTLPEWQK